ncbi:CAP domain-containing protein [Bosea psychrotolerans]|uniref:SCP domain-containing protein n=1 Tax=Bosea psychrotolerans TaxID=1871628 RepID=A0A2S4MR67_9HYPH|nr:CAP domain-containing protein [Bosea psychrotolerans]POR56777.1 hypothetical protein CYD53_101298 [Bosea psychrotolerans]
MDKHLFRMATLAMTLLAAGCASDPRGAAPLGATATARLATVKLDTVAATRIFNSYRASHGLGPVKLDPTLTAMAQRQANAMAAANTLSHDAGGSFVSRVHGAGLNAGRTAENVGGGYYSTEEAFAGWKASSGHDLNLRMPEATRFGIALAKAPQTQYGAWWALVIAGEPERRREITAGPFGTGAPAIR